MKTRKKHIAEKADMLESHEHKPAMEQMHDEKNPKEIIDKVESRTSCFGLHRRSEPLQTQTQDVNEK